MGIVPAIEINKGGGTLFIEDTINIVGNLAGDDFKATAGTIDAGTSTIRFYNTGTFGISLGSETLNNVVISIGSSSNFTITGTVNSARSTS